jgi:hypothetical protein
MDESIKKSMYTIEWTFRHTKILDNNIDILLKNIKIGLPFSFISVVDYNGIDKYNIYENLHLIDNIKKMGYSFLIVQEKWNVLNKIKNTNRIIKEYSLLVIGTNKYKVFVQRLKSMYLPYFIAGRYIKKPKSYIIDIYENNNNIFHDDSFKIDTTEDIDILFNKRNNELLGNKKFSVEFVSFNSVLGKILYKN